ncbi:MULTISPECIES: AfsR/SARP family transcriptional regulator [Streptomyces]|uniref:AfsR/SARP family transcriptional regulator n=1 Tax=Streptomyces nigra TaxID=1827580 RepID=UPI00367CB12D
MERPTQRGQGGRPAMPAHVSSACHRHTQVRAARDGCTVVGVSGNGADLQLLSAFELAYAGSRISLPMGAQRLLAFLAMKPGGTERVAAAEELWPDCKPCRAAANLRSALWHVRHGGMVTAIESLGQRLRLSPSVRVDLHRGWATARHVVSGQPLLAAHDEALVEDLSRGLLPYWSEDWLVLERERWDQMRVHALEDLAQQYQETENYVSALQTAMSAIAIDPFRETAQRIVIEVHVAEGNLASALKRYRDYEAFLQRELNVSPSPQMTQLLAHLYREEVGHGYGATPGKRLHH